jgi:uncharacterized protein with GYD domain
MPKYLIKASYTQAGANGVAAEGGSSRREAVRAACEHVGGSLDVFYYAFGDVDVYTICDLPDEEAALALAMAVNGSGGATCATVPLIAPEVVDAAARREVSFRPSGG